MKKSGVDALVRLANWIDTHLQPRRPRISIQSKDVGCKVKTIRLLTLYTDGLRDTYARACKSAKSERDKRDTGPLQLLDLVDLILSTLPKSFTLFDVLLAKISQSAALASSENRGLENKCLKSTAGQ